VVYVNRCWLLYVLCETRAGKANHVVSGVRPEIYVPAYKIRLWEDENVLSFSSEVSSRCGVIVL
jgi:hypothetical protein